jgi:hypothetical protein
MPDIYDVLNDFSLREYDDLIDFDDESQQVPILYTTVYDDELYDDDAACETENFDLQITVDLMNPGIIYEFTCWGMVDRKNLHYRENFSNLGALARDLKHIDFNDLYSWACGIYRQEVRANA